MTPTVDETRVGNGMFRGRPTLFNALPVLFISAVLLGPLSASIAGPLNRNIGWPGKTLAGNQCYGDGSGYGPFDYISERSKIIIVEKHHFTNDIEQLVAGRSGTQTGLESNLDYTLRAVPNHHRALWAMTRYYLKKLATQGSPLLEKRELTRIGEPPPECYFQRAKAFSPDDGMVSAIFGIYLHKRGRLDDALAEYGQAESKIPNFPELIYNMGLLYLDMDDIVGAQEYAERAENLGYPLTGLQKRISRRQAEMHQQ